MNLFGIHVTGVDLYESDDMESDDEEQNDWFDACVLAWKWWNWYGTTKLYADY